MEFCDIGLNLTDGMFQGYYNGKRKHQADIASVLQRSAENGVKQCILTGCTVDGTAESLELCKAHSSAVELYCTAGVHPTHSNDFVGQEDVIVSQLESFIINDSDRRIVAIGECGLDYDRLHFSTREQQLRGFQLQLDLSMRLARPLPLFLHNRNTDGDFIRIIRDQRDKIPRGGVVHSFTGSMEEMRELIDLGLYIGVNGCSLKSEENLAVVREIPLEYMLIETDAPWCGIKNTHAGAQYVKTKFPTKKPEKYEDGSLVKDRNEPCMICQVRTTAMLC